MNHSSAQRSRRGSLSSLVLESFRKEMQPLSPAKLGTGELRVWAGSPLSSQHVISADTRNRSRRELLDGLLQQTAQTAKVG